jgi:NIMA (never in mitosis gene a)-related kinase
VLWLWLRLRLSVAVAAAAQCAVSAEAAQGSVRAAQWCGRASRDMPGAAAAAAMAAPPPLPPRSVPGDFRWGRKLGQGAFGVVYEVHRKVCGRRFVVKQCNMRRMSRAEQEEAITEVHLLASLRHEYIVQYHDSFISAGQLNIVMEHCAGGDLATKLAELRRRGQRMPEASVWRYLLQVASALRFVHNEKILHRDIKSQNVFIGAKGDVRLGDFGVSKLLESTSDLARTKVGTPYFMSPELCESRPYSSKSDIWALGCLLYEMVALRPPFEADNIASLVLRIIRGQYDPVCRTYSSDVAWVVKHCCELPGVSLSVSNAVTECNSRSSTHVAIAVHAVALHPEARPSAAQLLDIPSIRRRALLLEVVDVQPPKDTADVGPRTPPNTPPRTADPSAEMQRQTPDEQRRPASTQPHANADSGAEQLDNVQRERRAVSASPSSGAAGKQRKPERYRAPIGRGRHQKGKCRRAPDQELGRAEMFNADHPPQPVRRSDGGVKASGTRPSSRVGSNQKPRRKQQPCSPSHNIRPSTRLQTRAAGSAGTDPTTASLETGSHDVDRTDSTEAQPSSSVRGGAKTALLQRCDDALRPDPTRRRQHRRYSTPAVVTAEQASRVQQSAAMAQTDTASHPERQLQQREAGSKVALSGAALGSWVSARACRPIVKMPVPAQALQTVTAVEHAQQRSPVFSPDSFGPPRPAGSHGCDTPEETIRVGEPIELKLDSHHVDQEQIQSELQVLRRQATVEGGLSEAQLESLLEYLRQGPKSPTRAEEETTMAHIAKVLPLEKMTVVTTMFKIIYKEETMAVAR